MCSQTATLDAHSPFPPVCPSALSLPETNLSLPPQVPPGGTNFQFRDPTEGRHAVWKALTSSDNPKPLNTSHYALAIGVQTYCMGGAGIYSAPTMAGPWSYEGSLYNQMVPEPEVCAVFVVE